MPGENVVGRPCAGGEFSPFPVAGHAGPAYSRPQNEKSTRVDFSNLLWASSLLRKFSRQCRRAVRFVEQVKACYWSMKQA